MGSFAKLLGATPKHSLSVLSGMPEGTLKRVWVWHPRADILPLVPNGEAIPAFVC
jgi:hypothetical protein